MTAARELIQLRDIVFGMVINMRVMAIDYGDVRTGIAVSDESASLLSEAWVIHERNHTKLAQTVASEALTRGVDKIVVGHPKNMNGTIGPRAEKSEKLADEIRGFCCTEVIMWDERLTTTSANHILNATGKRGKKRKNTVDAVAASLILENYLAFLSK